MVIHSLRVGLLLSRDRPERDDDDSYMRQKLFLLRKINSIFEKKNIFVFEMKINFSKKKFAGVHLREMSILKSLENSFGIK